MEAGADAFVLKRSIATDLLPAVALVRGGRGEDDPTATAGGDGGTAER